METVINKIFEVFKIKEIIILVLLISSSLLFIGENNLQKLGLNDYISPHKKYIGLAFIISICFVIILIFKFFYKKYQDYLINKYRNDQLRNLTSEEFTTIYYLYKNGGNAKLNNINSIIPNILISKNMIISHNIGDIFGFSFYLQPWVRDQMDKSNFIEDEHGNISWRNNYIKIKETKIDTEKKIKKKIKKYIN